MQFCALIFLLAPAILAYGFEDYEEGPIYKVPITIVEEEVKYRNKGPRGGDQKDFEGIMTAEPRTDHSSKPRLFFKKKFLLLKKLLDRPSLITIPQPVPIPYPFPQPPSGPYPTTTGTTTATGSGTAVVEGPAGVGTGMGSTTGFRSQDYDYEYPEHVTSESDDFYTHPKGSMQRRKLSRYPSIQDYQTFLEQYYPEYHREIWKAFQLNRKNIRQSQNNNRRRFNANQQMSNTAGKKNISESRNKTRTKPKNRIATNLN